MNITPTLYQYQYGYQFPLILEFSATGHDMFLFQCTYRIKEEQVEVVYQLRRLSTLVYNNSDISSAAKVKDDIRSIESCRRQFICQHYGRSIERSFNFHISVVIIVRRLVTATVVFDFESDTEENFPKEQDGKYNTSTA